MHRLLLVLCLAAAVAGKGQIQSPLVETGLTWNFDISLNLPTADWDFTGLPVATSVTQAVYPSSASPFAKSFAEATHMVDADGIQTFHSWSDANVYHGGYQNLVIAYSDPEVYFPYPFALNTPWSDTFAASYNSGIAISRTGTVESVCTESGTLVLPGGQEFPNAYRVEMVETIVDATVAGDYTIVLDGVYYFTNDCPFYRAAVITSTVLDAISSPEPTPEVLEYALWSTGSTVGIEEPARTATQVFPNPTPQGAEAVVAAAGPVQVWDASGRLVLEAAPLSGQPLVRLSATDLPAGTYVVTSAQGAPVRWVVQ
jgi:hypothetical protein